MWNKSQAGLQLVEKLATPLYVQSCCFSYLKPISFLSLIMDGAATLIDISEKQNNK